MATVIISDWLILRNGRHGRSSEGEVDITLCKTHLMFVREPSIRGGVSLTVAGRRGFSQVSYQCKSHGLKSA